MCLVLSFPALFHTPCPWRCYFQPRFLTFPLTLFPCACPSHYVPYIILPYIVPHVESLTWYSLCDVTDVPCSLLLYIVPYHYVHMCSPCTLSMHCSFASCFSALPLATCCLDLFPYITFFCIAPLTIYHALYSLFIASLHRSACTKSHELYSISHVPLFYVPLCYVPFHRLPCIVSPCVTFPRLIHFCIIFPCSMFPCTVPLYHDHAVNYLRYAPSWHVPLIRVGPRILAERFLSQVRLFGSDYVGLLPWLVPILCHPIFWSCCHVLTLAHPPPVI